MLTDLSKVTRIGSTKLELKYALCFESLYNVPEFSGSVKFRTWILNFCENTLRLYILFGDFMFMDSMTELNSSRTSFKTPIHLSNIY